MSDTPVLDDQPLADTAATVAVSQSASLGGDDTLDGWDDRYHRVDRYVMLHRLGQGSFGVVRAAYDPELDRRVAIKLLKLRRNDYANGARDLAMMLQVVGQLREALPLLLLHTQRMEEVHGPEAPITSASVARVLYLAELLDERELLEPMGARPQLLAKAREMLVD